MKWRTAAVAVSLLIIGIALGLVISASGPAANTPIAPQRAEARTRPASSTPASVPPAVQSGIAAAKALSSAFSWVAEQATPAVVTIKSERTVRTGFAGRPDLPDFFPHNLFPMPPQSQRREGIGSGVIVSPDGYILTNHHVIEGADRLTVVIGADEGTEVNATIVGTDPSTDIAVIKVDRTSLRTIEFGDSDSLRVGHWVLAIGSPFGEQLKHTVTAGVVSALGRSIGIIETGRQSGYAGFENFIQTDAAINPGNSGGALLNIEGKLVGINTAISSTTGSNAGVGFAIPINLARAIMDQLIEHGRVVRGYLGVTIGPVTADIQNSLELPDRHGAIVSEVVPDAAAARAGLRHGDVIRSIEGTPVKDVNDLRMRIASTPPGQEIALGVWREGHERSVRVTLGELPTRFLHPDERTVRRQQSETTIAKFGMTVATLADDMARAQGMEGQRGVLVTGVDPNGQAAQRGIQQGDLIQEVNLQPVVSVEEFERRVNQVERGRSVLLFVRRGQATMFIGLEVTR